MSNKNQALVSRKQSPPSKWDKPLMTDLTDELEEERRIIDAATAGPWVAHDLSDATFNSENRAGWWWVWQKSQLTHYGGVIEISDSGEPRGAIGEAGITDQSNGHQERADAEFIAHARTALPQRNVQVQAVLKVTDDLPERGPQTGYAAGYNQACRDIRRAIEEARA